jgi:hypothetical protein
MQPLFSGKFRVLETPVNICSMSGPDARRQAEQCQAKGSVSFLQAWDLAEPFGEERLKVVRDRTAGPNKLDYLIFDYGDHQEVGNQLSAQLQENGIHFDKLA